MKTAESKATLEEYVYKAYWGKQTLGDLLDYTVRDYPEKTALVQGKRRVTYGEFDKMVNRLCFRLLEMGIEQGDFVVVQLPNCVEFAFLQYALTKIGAVIIPMVHTEQIHEVRYAIDLCHAKTLVISSGYTKQDSIGMAERLRKEIPFLKNVVVVGEFSARSDIVSFESLISSPAAHEEDREIIRKLKPRGTDLLRINFSAGTTGKPKAAMRTHNDSLAGLKWDAVFHDWGENLLLFFPFGHPTGYFVGLDLQVYLGRRITLATGKFDPEEMLSLIEREKITAVYFPTPLLFTLAEALERRPALALEHNLSSLRKFVFGGAQAPHEVIRTVKETTGRPILQTWGMAEGAVTCTLITDPPHVQSFTVGRIQCPEAKVRVIDERDNDVPQGTPGELIYNGPFRFAGYYQDADLTQKSIDEQGYFHTGDQVVLDKHGNMKIVGRLKDLIRRGGEPISPVEIESLIQRHGKVADVAVVAMPDKRMIEKVCAYVVPKPNHVLTFEDIIAFMKEKEIATFKLPERIEFVDRLPRGEQKGNVLKRKLQEDIAQKLKAEGKI